jgi:GNAT superfamily N-acetyltransferase
VNDVAIRPARLDELEVIGPLRATMARAEGHDWDREYPGWQARFCRFFRAKQAAGDAQIYLAETAVTKGEIVGMAAFSVLDEYRAIAHGRPRGWVNSLYVVPEFRRRGIARRLMESGLDWLRKRGCVMARLRTSDDGEALYASMGFVPGREMELHL